MSKTREVGLNQMLRLSDFFGIVVEIVDSRYGDTCCLAL